MDGQRAAEDRILRILAEAVESETGEGFFRALVQRLAEALGVEYALVSELTRGGSHFRTLALWARGAFLENVEIPLAGTPCEVVLSGEPVFHADALQERFPEDHVLADWGAVSYGGVPLVDSASVVRGHLAFLDGAPFPDHRVALEAMRIFARRTVAEVERLGAERELRERDALISAVLSAVTDGIAVFETDGTIVFASRSAERVLRTEKLVGGSIFAFTSPEGEALLRHAMRRLGVGEGPTLFVEGSAGVLARRADGSQFPFEATLALQAGTARPAYVMVWRDLEERREQERMALTLREQTRYLREEIEQLHPFEEIVGSSAGLQRTLAHVGRVAPTPAAVLISGETGTGKELVARAIHARSPRAERALIKVNCAALPEGLVESELFGHEKGAFTGAARRRPGRFELADGGTLFLDEVGELPLDTQSKLLRVLQEGEFERVGGSETLRVDVRVLAASNRDLPAAVAAGQFREDLYYRLNVFPLVLPPLRERGEDIGPLADHFVRRHAPLIGRSTVKRVSGDAVRVMRRYRWPGNVRELESVIERALIMAPDGALELDAELVAAQLPALSLDPAQALCPAEVVASTLEEVERRHILATLEARRWRIEGEAGAARALGVPPSTLRSRMQSLEIRRPGS